jgi:hypothetical protein
MNEWSRKNEKNERVYIGEEQISRGNGITRGKNETM